ncbi:unnamed protein product, partial [Brassica rapa subsp. trilocularis]
AVSPFKKLCVQFTLNRKRMEAVAVAPMEEVRLGKTMRAETRDKRLKRKTTVTWIHTESSRSVAQVARQVTFTILEKKLLQQKQSDEVP